MTITEYIEQAIDESSTIEIEYVKYDGTSSKRSISDLSYSDEYGDDYIVGYCHLREEYRTFKISRIRRIDGKSFSLVSSNVSAGKTAYTGKTAYSSQTTSNLSPTPTPSTLNTPRVTPTTSSYKPKQTYSSSSYASPKKSEGCYIATMAYGSYEHPQVKILRKFRDEQLMPTALGRIFVKVYYWISPKMVSILSGHDSINRAIRCLLDCFIIHISKN